MTNFFFQFLSKDTFCLSVCCSHCCLFFVVKSVVESVCYHLEIITNMVLKAQALWLLLNFVPRLRHLWGEQAQLH